MHAIEVVNGKASMAYRKQGGTPWHGLGTAIDGHGTLEEMLREAQADFDVEKVPVYIMGMDGEFIEIPNRFATTRVNHDGQFVPFEVMKGRYHVVQNREVAEKALAIVGASHGDAVIETIAVLGEGQKFFVTIDLGALIIDPKGVNDRIARYLIAATSHDGTLPITFANGNIRVVCENTLTAGLREAQSVFKARHTPNAEDRVEEAKKVLNLSTQWTEAFGQMAQEMLEIPVPVGSGKIDIVMNTLFDPEDADTDRKKKNRQDIIDDIRARYTNEKNVGKVGANGWALYNAIVEHYDYGRKASKEQLTLSAIDPASLIASRKRQAQRAVLTLAG